MPRISPRELSELLGQKFPPTDQQADIIGAQPGPRLVVAGAGAGKTETMAARVVWLVANKLARPDQVLGLTFTRKAAQQLSQRIRQRLDTLAACDGVRDLDPSGDLSDTLRAITPAVSTYDSYAGQIIREYGLLMPVEPSARLITQTELYHIARSVVDRFRGELSVSVTPATVTQNLLKLISEMDNHMITAEEITDESWPFINLFDELPSKDGRDKQTQETTDWKNTQIHRLQYLPLVSALKKELADRAVITFGEQMSVAARLAATHPQVGYSQRRRYRVVMLDEYQDTSHAQRVLLRSLFGGTDPGLSVTAVGDPMQAIYGWRGATSANLENFVNDFPVVGVEDRSGAPKSELTTSWRNPPEVLDLANAVSATVLGPPRPDRTVQPLVARPGSIAGDVGIGWFATAADERRYVADELQRHWDAREPGFTAAVLVRKNRHSAPMAEELISRGIPVEIVGLSGLLDVAEVADLVAIATMLVRPQDNRAALRILGGPHVGLGIADMQALQSRARNLAGRAASRNEIELSDDPLTRLSQIIDQTVPANPEEIVGLTDAISDLGEPERYSEEGYLRLQRLSSQLRYLRTHSLGRAIGDIFADIEEVFTIRTEVLARQDPHADGAVGTVHLDRFAEEVANYPGSSLTELLDYFELARDQEDGLDPGEVTVRSDRVQILTVHKAKGLEWQVVSVLHADESTYAAKASTWLNNITAVPAALRGDADDAAVLDTADVETLSDLKKACKAYKDDVRAGLAEENTRLFYVAITRSERALLVTGSALSDTGARAAKPYANLEILKHLAPVTHWWEGDEAGVEKQIPPEAYYPPPARERIDVAAIAATSRPDPGTIEELWEKEVSALIDEQQRLASPVLEVEISRELTATDLVAMKNNPEQFARRLRRPVPFRPNAYAKRGTQFHRWLEDRFGATALLDEDQLPGLDEEVPEQTLEELKAAFLASQWADRTPMFVEQPFEVAIGHHVVRGRIDAIFRDGDSWLVLDWKTGRTPVGPDLDAAVIQLAVYRQAWAQLEGVDPSQVRAAFHYIPHDHTLEPENLPGRDELAALLDV